MLSILHELNDRLKGALEQAFPAAATAAAAEGSALDAQLGPASKPEFGDFQANGALALAKRLVELQGGSIGVTSTLGQGATFWVELPAA